MPKKVNIVNILDYGELWIVPCNSSGNTQNIFLVLLENLESEKQWHDVISGWVSHHTLCFLSFFGMDPTGVLSAPLVFFFFWRAVPLYSVLLKACKGHNFSASLNSSVVLSDFHLDLFQARSNPRLDLRGIKGYWIREKNGHFFLPLLLPLKLVNKHAD